MTVANQVIIFGASGDLTARKLIPALASLSLKKRPASGFAVIGCARRPKSDEQFRSELREEMPPELREAFDVLAPNLFYIATDVSSTADVQALAKRLDALPGAGGGRLFYLSLKPELFGPTVDQLASGGLLQMHPGEQVAWRRVIIEKPFGHDLASAVALNRKLHESLREDQIYRIDHYLGRRRCKTSWASASTTPSSSRSGTTTTSSWCRSRWPRIWAWRAGAAATTTPPARCAT